MARIRTIKPEFWADEKLAELSPIERLVFLGLIGMADDFGRLHDNEKVIDAFVFPYTDDSVRESLASLSRIGRIRRGSAKNGKRIIEIVNWGKHQRVDKPQGKAALPCIHEKDSKNPGENAIRERFANDSRMIRETSAPRPTTYDQRPTTNDLNMSVSNGRYSEEFEKFWSVFPKVRRTKKQEAYRKWKLALKKADAATLTKKAAEYAKSKRGQSEFAVMPSVWLNSGMWEDDPEAWSMEAGKVSRVPTDDDLKNWQPTGMYEK